MFEHQATLTTPVAEDEFQAYFDLRWRILRAPWHQPRGSERDDLESSAYHLMACDADGVPLAVGRLHFNNAEEAQIRYMAVEPAIQGRGLGWRILTGLEDEARRREARYIILHARADVTGFYQRSGYKIVKETHTLFGEIRHFLMSKSVNVADSK